MNVLIGRLGMAAKYLAGRLKRVAGITLVLSGAVFWMLVAALPPSPMHVSLLSSLGHAEKLSLAVTAGGASLVGGIILLLAPPRRRRRTALPRRFVRGACGSLSGATPALIIAALPPWRLPGL